jgi:predicted RNase H-like HicB family nuclease
LIEGTDDAAVSAYAPDLPGVAATGATVVECQRSMREAS